MKALYTVSQDSVQLSAIRPLRAAEVTINREVAAHDHDFHELCLVLTGKGRHLTAGSTRSVHAGTLIVTAPGQVHAFKPEPRMTVINVYYLTEWFLRELPEWGDSTAYFSLFVASALFRRKELSEVEQVDLGSTLPAAEWELRDIMREDLRKKPARQWQRSAFGKFLLLAARAAEQGRGRHVTRLNPEVWLSISRIERLIGEGKEFSLSRLADGLPFGADHLSRLFKAQTGRNPMSYYQTRRLLSAAAHLLDPGRSITDVSYEFGFSDPSHFSRLFRRQHGLTPREYRSRYGL